MGEPAMELSAGNLAQSWTLHHTPCCLQLTSHETVHIHRGMKRGTSEAPWPILCLSLGKILLLPWTEEGAEPRAQSLMAG